MSYFADLAQRQQRYEDLALRAMELALKKGASEVKIKVNAGKGIQVSARSGEVENIEFNQMEAMGILVYQDKRKASVSTNDFTGNSLEQAVDAALQLCQYTSQDEFAGLCDKEDLYQREGNSQAPSAQELAMLFEIEEDPDVVVKKAIALEKLGISKIDEYKSQGLKDTDGSFYSADYSVDTIVSSNGFCQSKVESSFSKYMGFIGELNGVIQCGSGGSYGVNPHKEWSDEAVVAEAIEHTLDKLGAKKIKTGKYPVIFRRTANGFMTHCLSGLAGQLIYQNSSYLKDKLGEQVFPEFLTIKENPWAPSELGSCLFDSDGVATRPLTLVEQGVIKEYLLGTYSARKLKMRCNGHNDPLYNTYVTADAAHTGSLEEIMAKVGSGLVVDSLMGQGVNLVNGNYSRGASGFYFENGQRVHAVDEVTIAGNLLDMSKNIAMLGTDIDTRRVVKVGSILLPEVTISGL